MDDNKPINPNPLLDNSNLNSNPAPQDFRQPLPNPIPPNPQNNSPSAVPKKSKSLPLVFLALFLLLATASTAGLLLLKKSKQPEQAPAEIDVGAEGAGGICELPGGITFDYEKGPCKIEGNNNILTDCTPEVSYSNNPYSPGQAIPFHIPVQNLGESTARFQGYLKAYRIDSFWNKAGDQPDIDYINRFSNDFVNGLWPFNGVQECNPIFYIVTGDTDAFDGMCKSCDGSTCSGAIPDNPSHFCYEPPFNNEPDPAKCNANDTQVEVASVSFSKNIRPGEKKLIGTYFDTSNWGCGTFQLDLEPEKCSSGAWAFVRIPCPDELTPTPTSTTPTPYPVPDCLNLTGPTQLIVGQPAVYSGTFAGNGDILTDVGLGIYNNNNTCDISTGLWLHESQNCSSGSCSHTFQAWTPVSAGQYTVYGIAWNDGHAECRGDCTEEPLPGNNHCGESCFPCAHLCKLDTVVFTPSPTPTPTNTVIPTPTPTMPSTPTLTSTPTPTPTYPPPPPPGEMACYDLQYDYSSGGNEPYFDENITFSCTVGSADPITKINFRYKLNNGAWINTLSTNNIQKIDDNTWNGSIVKNFSNEVNPNNYTDVIVQCAGCLVQEGLVQEGSELCTAWPCEPQPVPTPTPTPFVCQTTGENCQIINDTDPCCAGLRCTNTAQGEICYDEEVSPCLESGGEWLEFCNGCADYCGSHHSCTDAKVYSCDCGPEKCWNIDNKTCEAGDTASSICEPPSPTPINSVD